MNKLNVGAKVEVEFADGEKGNFTVAARSERFVILSNLDPMYFTYTIIDYQRNIIGADNRIFPTGYENYGGCRDNLNKLERGELKVTFKNSEALNGVLIKEREAE